MVLSVAILWSNSETMLPNENIFSMSELQIVGIMRTGTDLWWTNGPVNQALFLCSISSDDESEKKDLFLNCQHIKKEEKPHHGFGVKSDETESGFAL